MDWLVIVQIPDAGVCPVLQEQLDDFLLVLVTRQSSCHVQGCVAMGLEQGEGKKKGVKNPDKPSGELCHIPRIILEMET